MSSKQYEIITLERCHNCVMDTSDPDITFDEKGVCNYCQIAEAKAQSRRSNKLNLPWVIHNIKKKGRGRKYDVLMGLSGGVDSSYALHCVMQQGLRPLTFSVDTGWNTAASDENIMRLVETLKVPFYRYVINLRMFNKLQRAFLLSGTVNAEIPTDHILMATTYEMANKYDIKTVISGGNWQTEGTMPESFGYQARDLTHLRGVYRHFYGKDFAGLPTISLKSYLYNRFVKGIKFVNLLDYYDYNREKAIQELGEKYGWKDYGEKHMESVFTQWFQDNYLMNYGVDKRKPHYSSMIHSNQMERNEAIGKLQVKPDPDQHTERIMETLMMSPQDIPREPIPFGRYPNSKKKWDYLSKIYGYIPHRS